MWLRSASVESAEPRTEAMRLRSGTALQRSASQNEVHLTAQSRKAHKSSGRNHVQDPESKGSLRLLPGQLLGSFWPTQRLIHGLLVSRWLRDELYNHVDAVALSAVGCGCHIKGGAFTASLTRFRNKGARMELSFDTSAHEDLFFVECATSCISKTFRGLLRAFPNGAGDILSHLDLSHCCLGDGIVLLAQSIKECKVLASLLLNGNQILDFPAMQLAKGLRHCKELTRLDLGGNFLRKWVEVLSCLLENCRALRYLNLWGSTEDMERCSFLPEDIDAKIDSQLQQYQAASSPSVFPLSALNVSSYFANNDGLQLGNEECRELALILENCGALRYLDLSNNALWDFGFEQICGMEGLAKCTTLTSLKLSETQIGDAGLIHLVRVMQGCKNMRELTLSYNALQAEAGESVATILRSCCTLEHLDLSFNFLGDEGVKSISESLSVATCLKRLDLAANRIRAAGAKSLSEGVLKCSALVSLTLDRNYIADEGARWVAASVRNCTTIRTLGVAYTAISKAGIEKLASASAFWGKRLVAFSVGGDSLVEKEEQEQLNRAWAGCCVFHWAAELDPQLAHAILMIFLDVPNI